MDPRIHVAVGILYNSDKDRILITRRTNEQYLSGYWEFPGGKVKNGEDTFSALKREFFEELSVDVIKAKELVKVNYDYPDMKVLLDVFIITKWSGKPTNCENQEISWTKVNNLIDYKFPEANKYIIQTLCLPDIYGISRELYKDFSHLFSNARDYFNFGSKIFQLRLKFERNKKFRENIEKLSYEAKSNDVKLILNGVAKDLDFYPVDGIHLKSKELTNYSSRPISENYILGASCHNEKELFEAEKLGVNYAFLSPVLETKYHYDIPKLGWNNFENLATKVNFPIYALGGMSTAYLEVAKDHGAYGIAMIGGVEELLLKKNKQELKS